MIMIIKNNSIVFYLFKKYVYLLILMFKSEKAKLFYFLQDIYFDKNEDFDYL